jgi:hypothetical protein
LPGSGKVTSWESRPGISGGEMLVHRVAGSVLPVVGIRPAARGAAVDPMALSPGHLGKGAGRGRVHWAVEILDSASASLPTTRRPKSSPLCADRLVTGEDIDAG